ncbi:MAG: PIG-L family deacetylase [Ruminococcaceae bacterium]|nr:PIG-L family deacetylase [Oscillospiraceae bacterium]
MKILMIGAHQDDAEFRCGGTAYKLAQLGHSVKFLSLTNGCGGHHLLTAEETVAVRAKESAAVAELLGIEYEIWSDQADCALIADLPTRRRLICSIRSFAPDIIITHRPNDYHADHRACAMLVQDAAYMLIVPHECPEAAAMRTSPVIMYYEDGFTNPAFNCDLVVGIDEVIDIKLQIAHLNASQVYEWLPYTNGETVPTGEKERFEWLKGLDMSTPHTDEEILSLPRGYAVRFARPAAKFREKLTEKYGTEQGAKIRYAEAFEVCEYGAKPSDEVKALFAAL